MTKYKCGHEGKPVLLDDNVLSAAAYFQWKDTEGYEGNKSKCWDCWCEKSRERIKNKFFEEKK